MGAIFLAEHGLLTAAASLVEHGLQACGLSSFVKGLSCLVLRMWDLPRPGIQPTSPALAGRFLKTGPPGKSGPVSSNFTRKITRNPEFEIPFVYHMRYATCGSLVPQPGIETMPPALGAQSLNHQGCSPRI